MEFKDHTLLYLGQIGAPLTPEQRTRLLQLRDRSVFIYMLLLKYLPIEVPHEVVRVIVYLSIHHDVEQRKLAEQPVLFSQ